MADYDVGALAGTVYGIAGTGIALGTLGRMTNMVFENMPRNQRRKGKKTKRKGKTVYVQRRDSFGRPVYVPFRI